MYKVEDSAHMSSFSFSLTRENKISAVGAFVYKITNIYTHVYCTHECTWSNMDSDCTGEVMHLHTST